MPCWKSMRTSAVRGSRTVSGIGGHLAVQDEIRQVACALCAGSLRMCQTGAVDDQFSEVTAMARAVKRAGDALVEAVRVTSNPAGGPALRAAHAQVFEH